MQTNEPLRPVFVFEMKRMRPFASGRNEGRDSLDLIGVT